MDPIKKSEQLRKDISSINEDISSFIKNMIGGKSKKNEPNTDQEDGGDRKSVV